MLGGDFRPMLPRSEGWFISRGQKSRPEFGTKYNDRDLPLGVIVVTDDSQQPGR
jgi:hypothetical protein